MLRWTLLKKLNLTPNLHKFTKYICICFTDGKFIFQLAAHQQNTHQNQLATTAQCRWVPVPTVILQHKNSVNRFGQNLTQNYQNKTIWPYLVTDQPTSDIKSTFPIYQSQSLLATKSGDCRLQQDMATATNVLQRSSRKYSTSSSVLNITDFLHQNRQPKSLQLRTSSKFLQYHQNQSFMMIATKAIKGLRHTKQRQRYRIRSTKRRVIERESLLPKIQQQPTVNLENIVQNLWCRRNMSELLHKQILSNNNFETVFRTKSPVGFQRDYLDSPCPNVMIKRSKRRSLVSPLPNITTIYNESIISTSIDNCDANSGPNKKYKSGPKQQQTLANNGVKITNPTMSANNHSITAILSSNVYGAKRGNGSTTTTIDSNNCFVSNTISTSSSLIMSQKNILTAQPSLLRTLLKSSSCETRLQPVLVNSNDIGHKRHHSTSSINQSAIKLITPLAAPKINISSAMPTKIALPPILGTKIVKDTAMHTSLQLPLHHAAAGEQFTAAGYLNVLYHQNAMVYQNHSEISQPLLTPIPLPKSQPSSLLSTQFPISESVINSWQQQLNQQPIQPLRKRATDRLTTVVSKLSPLKVVTPYSSPMTSNIVNCSNVLNAQEHQLQQYEQMPSVDQPYMYHKFKLHQKDNKVQRNVTTHDMEYGANITEKYRVIDSNDSITSIGKLIDRNHQQFYFN